MDPLQAVPDGPLDPVDRAVRVRFDWAPPLALWGASWAFVCGALAALPWSPDSAALARLVAAWFLAVPLAGALWVPFVRRADIPEAGRADAVTGPIGGTHGPAPGLGISGALVGVLCLALSFLLLPAALFIVLVLVAVAMGVAVRSGWRLVGARSAMEILLPSLVGWFALSGPVGVPAPQSAGAGPAEVFLAWLSLNWPVLMVLIAFTVVHHGMTADRSVATVSRRRLEIGFGYVLAVAALAIASRPLGATLVTLLYVLQWPFQVELTEGRSGWHFRATQWLAMGAMLAAAVAAGTG